MNAILNAGHLNHALNNEQDHFNVNDIIYRRAHTYGGKEYEMKSDWIKMMLEYLSVNSHLGNFQEFIFQTLNTVLGFCFPIYDKCIITIRVYHSEPGIITDEDKKPAPIITISHFFSYAIIFEQQNYYLLDSNGEELVVHRFNDDIEEISKFLFDRHDNVESNHKKTFHVNPIIITKQINAIANNSYHKRLAGSFSQSTKKKE